jgi:hypothetical protein
VLFAPAGLVPPRSVALLPLRWRLAYAHGFLRAFFGWRVAATAARLAGEPAP